VCKKNSKFFNIQPSGYCKKINIRPTLVKTPFLLCLNLKFKIAKEKWHLEKITHGEEVEYTHLECLGSSCCKPNMWKMLCQIVHTLAIGMSKHSYQQPNQIIQHHMCIFFYTRLYFSNKAIILFLKKPYLVYSTLILMDSNITKVWPYDIKTTKVIINTEKTCLFNFFSFNICK
jgi:hypothetical protein